MSAFDSYLSKSICPFAGLDENLMRHELSSAERSQQTARRKELYEALHPETVHGSDRRSSSRQNGDLKTGAFTKATAAATGQSERNIQRDARRGRPYRQIGNTADEHAVRNYERP